MSDNDSDFESRPLLSSPPPTARKMSNEKNSKTGPDGEEYGGLEPAAGNKGSGLTRERLFVVVSILVTELCERLTYYSVVANMVLFCTSVLKFTSDDASVVTLVFAGKTCFFKL